MAVKNLETKCSLGSINHNKLVQSSIIFNILKSGNKMRLPNSIYAAESKAIDLAFLNLKT
jgi:hypothetical protein